MNDGPAPAAQLPAVGPERQRLDKWLFFARVVKSRSLAARLVAAGGVRINAEKTTQASRTVKAGDVLTINAARRVLVYRILDCGTRRGPAPEAALLYEDMSPPPLEKPVSPLDQPAPARDPGAGRPTKKERRAIDRLDRGGKPW